MQKILTPMIAGEVTGGDVLDDDVAYVIGLGLLTEDNPDDVREARAMVYAWAEGLTAEDW